MITQNTRKYLNASDRPMLESRLFTNCDFKEIKQRKIKNALKIYLVTMIFTALAVALLVSFCAIEYHNPYLSDEIFTFVTTIAKSTFKDITADIFGNDFPVGNTTNSVGGILKPQYDISDKETETGEISNETQVNTGSVSKDSIYDFDYSKVPVGETPIIPMDLSMSAYGADYIHNATGLAPDTKALLSGELKENVTFEYLSAKSSPTVLIIHTHGTEAYSDKGAISFKEEGEIARSNNTDKNVVAVGRAFKNALKKHGINSIHCEIMHDADGYRDSYSRAEATIKQYLERYPTIRLVVDLHRDAVVRSDGSIVRPVTVVDGKAVAQVMCVVGSNWGGDDNERWEGNLALALKLREKLNSDGNSVCRPAYLKESTYNQEFAPYSLLLEVGACGNSLEESIKAAELTAKALSEIIIKK